MINSGEHCTAASATIVMTLTPLHAAFVWFLKPRYSSLSFAALTLGSFVPDLEPLASFIFGWSVFCGWDFPCSLAPDRLILHSIVGALTIDVLLTMVIVWVLGRFLVMEKFGVHGFTRAPVASRGFYASAAIGGMSHVLVDWLHHPANPVFWPLPIDGSYYVDGLLLPYMSVFQASLLVAVISAALIVASMAAALHKAGRPFWLVFYNPIAALGIVTKYLSQGEKRN